MDIKQAEFSLSAPTVSMCPKDTKPEYAFIGRSNVGFGEYNAKGNTRYAQPFDEIEVNLLWFQTNIYQDKHVDQLFAL